MAEITLDVANSMIKSTLEAGRALKLNPLSVIIVDQGGHVKAFSREDGAAPGRFDIAFGKAFGSIMLGMGGTAQMARAEQQAYFMAAINGLYGGKTIPVPGGVLIKNATGKVVGAMGVTGDTSDNDAKAAKAGIEAASLVAEI